MARTPSATCDLLQAFGREIILQFGKPHQMHKRPAGATAKSRPVREHGGLPHPSGKAVCLTLKRKGTFAPSSQSEGASAGLKPIKASCVKRRGGREMLIIMTRKNAIKKNKEKGKTDPIWEANEIQMQNRPLRSVCCKAAASGAAFTCQDAVPLGPPEMPLCSAAGRAIPWSILGCDRHGGCGLAALAG